MNIKLVIAAVTPKHFTSRAGKPCTTFSISGTDGSEYKCGFSKPTCEIGDEVEFMATSGQYGDEVVKNSLRVTQKGTGAPAPTAQASQAPAQQQQPTAMARPNFQGKTFPVAKGHGDRSIIRQNSLMNARELLVACVPAKTLGVMYKDGSITTAVLELAMKFEGYSTGDLYPNGILDLINEQKGKVPTPVVAEQEQQEQAVQQATQAAEPAGTPIYDADIPF